MSHRPRKRFGQNFLQDTWVISEIVASIQPQKDDHIVEIGPGRGALTEPLLQRCNRLEVVEIDRDLVASLKRKFDQERVPRIHCCDALQTDFRTLADDRSPLRIVGNLPYNISTPLIFHLLSQLDCIRDMHFMLQKEVVERICATPGSRIFGRLSVMTQYLCQPTHLFDVNPQSFFPEPAVMSSIVRLQPAGDSVARAHNPAMFAEIVKQAFSQRRKTLRNSLRKFIGPQALEKLEIDPSARPETLNVIDFVRISNTCSAADSDLQTD